MSRESPGIIQKKSLLKVPGFLPLYICQFGGALNDNIFKSALLVIIAFRFAADPAETALLNNLAAALLIIPFFLFSPLAGQLADRNEKSRMIRTNKLAELAICAIGTLALASGSLVAMLIVLFALGTQSAMFGPNKYAVLPQLLSGRQLVAANAQITAATFIAILAGTLVGGLLAKFENLWLWLGGSTFLIALIGVEASKRLPELEVADPKLRLDWNLARQSHRGFQYAKQDPIIWLALVGICWFWFLGSAYLTQLPALVRFVLAGDELLVSALIFCFIVGIGLGAALCVYLSRQGPELGVVPLALFMVSLVSVGMGLLEPVQQVGWSSTSILTAALIHLLGWAGGLLGVPLYASLQFRSTLINRARIIAANNLANAVLMVLSAVMGILILGVFELPLKDFFFALALLNLLVMLWFFRRLTQPTLRLLAQILAALAYRIRTDGIDHIPERGAALLVSNHVSYADAILLMAAIPRPVRFIITRDIYEKPWLTWILKMAGCIPLGAPLDDRANYHSAFASARETLRRGDLLFIFPEGQLSRDGSLQPFKRGLEKILEDDLDTSVVPMAIHGMWGSFFSREGGRAFGKLPKLSRRPIKIQAGQPMLAKDVDANKLHQSVSAMLAEEIQTTQSA